MFKFNFSEEQQVEEAASAINKLDWDDANELDISLDLCENGVDSAAIRLIEFDHINIKLLKREAALAAIGRDTSSTHPTLQAEHDHSDLLPSKYEGGLKVWECTEDIGHYLISKLGNTALNDKDVLDLGCGSGLLGIIALHLGANTVTFQDYNQEVLTHWTSSNVLLNFFNERTIKKKCKFWSGDWESFSKKCLKKFDIILTSETIYNPDNYEKLRQLFFNHMYPNSIVYLAAKSVYFSLGGSVQLFLSYINKKSEDFIHRQVFKSDDGVQRVIIEIKLKTG